MTAGTSAMTGCFYDRDASASSAAAMTRSAVRARVACRVLCAGHAPRSSAEEPHATVRHAHAALRRTRRCPHAPLSLRFATDAVGVRCESRSAAAALRRLLAKIGTFAGTWPQVGPAPRAARPGQARPSSHNADRTRACNAQRTP
jgi:hypothetical protein